MFMNQFSKCCLFDCVADTIYLHNFRFSKGFLDEFVFYLHSIEHIQHVFSWIFGKFSARILDEFVFYQLFSMWVLQCTWLYCCIAGYIDLLSIDIVWVSKVKHLSNAGSLDYCKLFSFQLPNFWKWNLLRIKENER